MNKKEQENNPNYGNWVSDKLITKTIIGLVFTTGITILLFELSVDTGGFLNVLKIICLIFAIVFLVSIIYFLKAKQMFSYTGGKLQEKVLNELISKIKWNGEGRALDIGCGSGVLTIKLAKKYKSAKITGIDYWGDNWDYCKDQCEKNSEIEGAESNTEFIKASASKLPFDNETFDLVVSNMTFHEVGDCKEKIDSVYEALRILKNGSPFVFQDLFKLQSYFGTIDELLDKIKSAGVKDVKFTDTSQLEFIPKTMKLPFMLGAAGIVYGIK